MQGVIDNAREAHLADTLSIERAWQLWNAGELSHVTVIAIAKHNDCECGGNREGLICFNGDHMDLRIAMVKGLKGTIETLRAGNFYESPSSAEILASMREIDESERESPVVGRVDADQRGGKGDTIA